MSFVNNLAYEASAGSGKTFMLVVRYLSLLFLDASPSKIVALTFTNKAANEMQERIISTLEELQDRGELQEIIRVTNLSKEHILQNRQKVLNSFLSSHVKIMTIDSFFTQILRKFSLYTSLMPDFSTANAQHETKLLTKFLQEVRVSNKEDTLINLLLQSNKKIGDIFTLLDDFYIKFQELKNMEFKKENQFLHEEEVLACMKELEKIVHSCKNASATAKNGVHAKDFKEVLAKNWLGRESLNYSTFSKCFTPKMDELLHKIQDDLKNYYRAKEQNFFYALKELVQIYANSKKKLYMDDSELSFNDVTYLVYKILKLIDDSNFLYFRLDSQIEHILLDEFQDTSILQYEILQPLIDEILSGNGVFENGSFFFVGDVKQSIYRFRGGVSALFESVERQNGTHVEKLLTNYRSQKEVVLFVNNLFQNKIKNYTPQLVKDGANGGFVEVLKSDMPLEAVVEIVKNLISLGANINEIAILCATNSDGEEIKKALESEQIEVVTETTTKLINQKNIKAILEYLKYLYFDKEIYKRNFFALISKEVVPLKKVCLNQKSVLEIVKNIIEEFSLFDNDFNIIRFLDTVSRYSDIEALLFEYERESASATTSELNGVRVLSIHKSKGLEFEHVVVMDRLKKLPASRDVIIYEYENIELKNIYLRMKNRDELDKNYSNALKKEAKLVVEDRLNALYVAFTRAKETLFIVSKSKDSSFELLDLEFLKHGDLQVKKHVKQSSKELESFEFKSLYYGTQNEILSMETQKDEDLKSINFGLAMHYVLEMIEDFKEQNLDQAINIMLNKYGHILEDGEIEDLKNRVLALLKNEEFLSLCSGKCYREAPIKYKKNLKYIDLLVEKESLWSVIDYKSSTLFNMHHKKQVKQYMDVTKEITKGEVNGYICYLLKDSIRIDKVF